MMDDLDFYQKHSVEIYFRGLVFAIIMFLAYIGFMIYNLYLLTKIIPISPIEIQPLLVTQSVIVAGLIGIPAIGIIMIKLYLHLRKEHIEIKEMIINDRN